MPTSVIDRPLNGDNEKDLFDIDGYQRALVEFIKGAVGAGKEKRHTGIFLMCFFYYIALV